MPFNESSAPTSFDCPVCNTPIPGYDLTESSYFGCAQCQTYFYYGDTGPIDRKTTFPTRLEPTPLAVGSEGYIDGKWVRVTGIIKKREEKYADPWLEYVLMTKESGYQVLSEFNGHWMVMRPAEGNYQEEKGKNVTDEDREYTLYNRYNCRVLNAVGEFYWDVLEDSKLNISEYIHPPYLLSREVGLQGTEWYKAVYKTPQEITTAFGLPSPLPKPLGIGAIQPSSAGQKRPTVTWLATRLALLVVVIQVLFYIIKPQKTLFDQSYSWNSDSTLPGSNQPIVTSSFAFAGPSAMAIKLKANVDNNWVEVPISLINETSGQSYEFTRTVEYYHGIDSGESWEEGAQKDEAILSHIPSGQYHLNLYPNSEGKNRFSVHVTVVQNPILYSNLFLMLILIAIYPIVLFIQQNVFEHKRWEESDFGP
ncbi:DUF4178 domain-containing protein [Larkinella rosea]|uniref:DUF4178 domain-containing protein n=1 Tax=Larkinella rosea TaxID=2025312 RepID=A0A3P1C113_9BACT|nr:DUF4178 domain-containing protein [Larkinella rosea]RRB06753.1 DUF4178 domain-containing protein [Larkinella rosea]